MSEVRGHEPSAGGRAVGIGSRAGERPVVRDGHAARPWRRRAALAITVSLALVTTVLAIRSEGFRGDEVDLNDAGVWVVNGERGLIGRVNTQIGKLEVALSAPGEFEIDQVDDTVVADLTTNHEMATVDIAHARLGRPAKVPDRASTRLGGRTAALSDEVSGKVWVTERTRAGNIDTASRPTVEVGEQATTAVGVDGTSYSYADGAGELVAVAPGGEPRSIPVPFAMQGPELSAVGDQPVMFEPATGRVVVPQRGTVVQLDPSGRVQLPGPGRDRVLVATDTALLDVPLGGGDPEQLSGGGTGAAVAPVWLAEARASGGERGCAFAAWTARPSWAQVCPDRPAGAERAGAVPRTRPGATLRLRVNRNRVVLNDTRTGFTLLFTDDRPVEIDNWLEVLPDDHGPQPEERIVQKPRDDCDADRFDADVQPDEVGTRAGRPVIVRVLSNDRFPDCIVPVVTVPDKPAREVADVAVVDGGTAIQVSPTPARREPITFTYSATALGRSATSSVTVRIVDPSLNSPPRTEPDTTTVVAGRTVRHNVLGNDVDPEGDAMSLIGIRVDGKGSATDRSDGEIAYSAPGGVTGDQTVTYTVADEFGAESTGTLKVAVTPEGRNVAPTARNDRVDVTVGRRRGIDLLANDSDPNGDPLTIAQLAGVPAALDVRRDGAERVTVTASAPGTYTFSYTVSDGEAVAVGYVRVDANPAGLNRPPVAVRDDLAARPGVPAFRDLIANDIDPDGDLLAVTAVRSPNQFLSVALIDMHIVRVTAPAGFNEAIDVRYTVSDGQLTSEGMLVVRPWDTARVDQPPVVADDETSVRAGNVVTVRVLDNDVDPEGERLRITRVDPLTAAQGQVFVQDDHLRYQSPPSGGAATVRLSYTAEDPGGNRADGWVTLRVFPVDQTNRPPVVAPIEARVFDGSEVIIGVDLASLDPDGDVVTLVGLSDRDGEQPTRGHAQIVPGGIRYRADRGASGTDQFAFVVRDAGGLDATGVVRVAVTPRPSTNSSPVAVADRFTARAGETKIIDVLANDTDADRDPLVLLSDGPDAPSQPRGGQVSPTPDRRQLSLSIEPGAPAGDVSFTYTVADGRGGSARGIVTVTVVVGDLPDVPPAARDDVVAPQAPGAVVDVNVLANDRDPDGDTARLTVAVVPIGDAPAVDAHVLPDGRIRVKLGDRSVQFFYSVTDAGGSSAQAAVSIPVMANRPPVCEIGAAEVRAGDEVVVDVRRWCRDPDGAGVSVSRLVPGARGGTARLDGDRVVFTAAPEVFGDGGFQVIVTDGTTTALAGVVVTVTGRNFAPRLSGTTIELPAGARRSIDLTALVSDLNSQDAHTFSNLRGATPEVRASLGGPVLVVQADDTARGATALLTVSVSDGANLVDGQIEVRVLRHDGLPPVAVDDTARTYQEKPVDIDVLANDVDPVGKGLGVEPAVSATPGTAVVIVNRVRYSPPAGFFGEALVTYWANDASRDPERASAATVRVSVIGRPSRPPAPTGVPESRQVRLGWGAAAPNGAPIDHYVVETDSGLTRQSPSTSLIFDGLANGMPYRFRVAAHNEAVERPDQLAFSEWSAPITPDTRPGTPAPPQLAFGDGQVAVSWAPPTNEGTPITNYQLRVSGAGARDVGPATSYVWTGLANGVKYDFSVRAENGAGFGEWSSPSNDPVNGVPAGPPGVVPGVTAVRLDEDVANGGVVQVGWDTPAPNGDAGFTFEVTVSPEDVAPISITDATQRSAIIRGLVLGKRYTFGVRATNKAGTGPMGTTSVVPAAKPGEMGAPLALEDDRSVIVGAMAPADNGAPISRVEAQANAGAWQQIHGPIAAGVAITAPVGGLVNGMTYTISVRACNEVGCGSPSPPSNPARPFGDPGAPNVLASRDGAAITWTWSPPDGNGRAVTGYEVSLDGIPVAVSGTSYSQEFFDHASHTLYVVAVNEAGRLSPAGARSATADPPPLPLTTAGGQGKHTWDSHVGPSGLHANEVPPDSPVTVACKVMSPSGSVYVRLPEWGNRWMLDTDLTDPYNPRLAWC